MDIIETPEQPEEENAGGKLSRRRMLGLAATGPVVLLGLSAAMARASGNPAAAPCYDPNAMPQAAMRRTLNYKVQSADPNKRCGGCSFFHATAGDCGKCDLLSGGPTSAASVCDSWAKKA